MKLLESEKKLIKELLNVGFKYKGINDLFKRKQLPSSVVKIILEWFPQVYKEHRGSGDHLIRALISAKEPFDPDPLIKFFEEGIYNSVVMGGVAHVLATSNTTDISVWLKTQLKNEYRTFQRASLVQGLPKKGGFKTDKELKNFLKAIYDKYPIEVLELLKKIGSREDIAFLEEKLKPIERAEIKDIRKLITQLNKK